MDAEMGGELSGMTTVCITNNNKIQSCTGQRWVKAERRQMQNNHDLVNKVFASSFKKIMSASFFYQILKNVNDFLVLNIYFFFRCLPAAVIFIILILYFLAK